MAFARFDRLLQLHDRWAVIPAKTPSRASGVPLRRAVSGPPRCRSARALSVGVTARRVPHGTLSLKVPARSKAQLLRALRELKSRSWK